MRLEWTEPAIADLAAIQEYIARDSVRYAAQFIERLVLAAEKLASFPAMGREVPEAQGEQGVRELLFRDYRIIYRHQPELVQVLAVVHGSRDLTRGPIRPWETE